MAAVAANILAVVLVRGDDANIAGENAAFKTKVYHIWFDHNVGGNTLTAVAGGTDTLDVAIDTAINGMTRNNKTVTAKACSLAGCAHTTDGTSFAGTISLSGSTASITPKSSNWSSNATISASYGMDRPYILSVTVTEA
jgi:hypothetical protein